MDFRKQIKIGSVDVIIYSKIKRESGANNPVIKYITSIIAENLLIIFVAKMTAREIKKFADSEMISNWRVKRIATDSAPLIHVLNRVVAKWRELKNEYEK